MKTKRTASYSFQHTQDRLKERYSLDMTEKEYKQITDKIRILLPDYMEVESGEKQGIFTLRFKGKDVIFVYSFTFHRIKTVLPQRIKGW